MNKVEVATSDSSSPIGGETGPAYSLRQLVFYFLKLGTIGFGGPVALVGYMRRDLVEQRQWISETDYKEGLALSQLAPGPLAAQLGMYLGYVHYRVVGSTLVGLAFVLPSFLMVVALGWLYSLYGGLAWMQAVFYGVAAAVIGIIANSAYKLTTKTIGKDKLRWVIFLVTAVVTVVTETEQVWLFLLGGLVVWLVKVPPRKFPGKTRLASFAGWPLLEVVAQIPAVSLDKIWSIFIYFVQAGAFVFGSGLAIVPFLYGGIVKENHWLTDKQFVDAVAVAMITPGPVVITVGFIGFLVAGLLGACAAAVATFMPCYVITTTTAPYFRKYGKRPGIAAFVDGVTAAAIGAITGAVIVLGRRTIIDIPTALLALVTFGLLWWVKKVPEPLIVLGAAVIGLMVYPLVRA